MKTKPKKRMTKYVQLDVECFVHGLWWSERGFSGDIKGARKYVASASYPGIPRRIVRVTTVTTFEVVK